MAEYIEREALIAHIKDLPTWWADAGGVYGRSMKYPEGMFDCEEVISSVENAPAADVAPVVHGRWTPTEVPFMNECEDCSVCGYRPVWGLRYNYCPKCGARMDGGADDEM